MISKEFRLVAACCAWPHSDQHIEIIRAAATKPIDWIQMARVIRRHRVDGLVLDGLLAAGVPLPPDFAATLQADSRTQLRHNFLFLAEAARLQDLFTRAGISLAFLKGVCLAMRAYGTLAVRQSKDIDLLINLADAPKACAILSDAGYVRRSPPPSLSEERLNLWYRLSNQMEWAHRDSGLQLELHWRPTRLNGMLRQPLELERDYQEVRFSESIALRTLEESQLLVYLCVHGAGHGWCRLKWLADVAAILTAMAGPDIEGVYRAAQRDGAGRAVAQALLLCERLFALPLPGTLSRELRGHWIHRCLAWCALRAMTRGDAAVEIYDLPLGTTLIVATHFLLVPTWRAFFAEILAKSIGEHEFITTPLPLPVYPFVRLPVWLWRRARRLIQR